MKYGFCAYIDESGDEGFKFPKSSEWFVMSAVMHRVSKSDAVHKGVEQFHRTARSKRPFHFKEQYHDERVGFLNIAAQLPIRCVSVLVHKPSLDPASYMRTQSHYLFYFTSKLLLERISWCCRSHTEFLDDTPVKVIFSNRRQLSEKRLLNYMGALRYNTEMEETIGVETTNHRIDWNYIKPNLIELESGNERPGLQIADAVCSGTRRALELTSFGLTEHRYVKLMKPIYWKENGTYQPHAIKFLPRKPSAKTGRYHWLRHFP